jgi:hypothetical protein
MGIGVLLQREPNKIYAYEKNDDCLDEPCAHGACPRSVRQTTLL